MVGKATLAMVVSSTCIKVASDRPMVHINKLGGVKEAGAVELIANPLTLERRSGQKAGAHGLANQR
jgi:hypothetical protein